MKKKLIITLSSLILVFVGAYFVYQTYAVDTMNELFISRFTEPEESEEDISSEESATNPVAEAFNELNSEESVAYASEESSKNVSITTVKVVDESKQVASETPSEETTEVVTEQATGAVSTEEMSTPEAIYMPETSIYTDTGEPVELQSLLGQPIIINFWATWCPPCIEEMPDFQEAYEEYGDEVHFVMLNATESRPGETIQVAQDFLEEQNLELPVYYDQNYANQIVFGTSTLPSTLFINSDGEVTYGHRGQITYDQLAFMITDVLE